MAIVHRFILPDAVAAGHDIFMAGVGLFTAGVLDAPLSATAQIAAAHAATGVLDLGIVDNSPASGPTVAAMDPYPQYVTVAELVASIQGGTDDVATALDGAYLPKWKPMTAYTSLDIVLNPSGQIVRANSPFTSGSSYNAANWTVLSSGSGGGGGGTVSDATDTIKGVILLAGDLAGAADGPVVVNGANHTHTTTQLNAIPTSQKGTSNGVATLGADGKIPVAQLPPIAISEFLGQVSNEAQMLALTGQRGDWCMRTDLSQSFILIADNPSLLSSWAQFSSPGQVSSVAGRTGVVVLVTADITDLNATRVPFAVTGFTSTDTSSALVELKGLAADAGDIWSGTAKTLSSATLSADSDLNVPIAANEKMWLDYYMEFTGTTASTTNLKATLTVPSGATGFWSSALDYDAAGSAGTAKGALGDLTTTKTFKLSSGVVIGIVIRAKIINNTTAGNIVLSLAQNTEDLSNPVTRQAWAKVAYSKVT